MNVESPESVGMSSERLARIETVINNFIQGDRLPGVMTLLQRKGKIVHFGQYGSMNVEKGTPMQEDAIIRIFSMTKPLISVAVMMLVESGRISLNDPVAAYIPAFAKTQVCTGSSSLGLQLEKQQSPMTILHLLTHTAGLSYGWFFDSPVDELYRQAKLGQFDRNQPLQEIVEKIASLPLYFQPGTKWRYSMATDALGHLIQVASDMPLDTYFKECIFQPLGMVDTDFTVPADKLDRLAPIYTSEALYNPTPILPENVFLIGDITKPTQSPSGGAGLASTITDYLQFCRCLLNHGAYDGGQLISRKTLDWMTANHIPDHMMPLTVGLEVLDHGFGLGFRVPTRLGEARTLKSMGEFGWAGAANTFFWVDPAEDFIGLFVTQYLPLLPYPVTDRFRNLAYAAIVD